MGEWWDAETYSVEVNGDGTVSVNDGLLALELGDFAYDAHMLADEAVKVGSGDARGGKLFRHGGMANGNWELGNGQWETGENRFQGPSGNWVRRGGIVAKRKKKGSERSVARKRGKWKWQSGQDGVSLQLLRFGIKRRMILGPRM